MCGVVAIYGYGRRAAAIDPAEVVAIRDAMASRGPDGEGLWFSPDQRVALGHRRLAIIGLGDQGAQPMALERPCGDPGADEGSLVVSYNGEIYNYLALRRELEARGHELRTCCDTEVILHLYEDHGDALVDRLRGMYALALWDGSKRRLLLARDPYGIKPLYYRDDGVEVRVASQVRPLASNGHGWTRPNEASLAAFFLFGNIPEPLTVWEGVREVPAGSCVVADAAGVHEPTTFFSVAEALKGANDESLPADPAESVRQALKDSVVAHLVADVEVGVFLSSGLDSAALLGLAAEEHGQMRAVTLGFSEFEGSPSDEVPMARAMARRYGAKHVVTTVSDAEFRASWPAILESMDQPTIDGVNTWLVSRLAVEAGLKVVLSGLGGDELFGGYPSFSRVPRWARIVRGPAAIPGLGAVARRVLRRLPLRGVSPKAAGVVEYGGSIERLWLLQRGLFMPWELPELLGEERARAALKQLDLDERLVAVVSPDPGSDLGRISALESSLYMRNQLLRDSDWASMAHSLEVRFPLVDARLLPALAPVLLGQQGRGDAKRLLAAAPRPPLFDSSAARPKTGFSVPLGQWLTHLAGTDSWRKVPMLAAPSCPWARRWAYIVADCFGLLAP